MSSVIPRKKKRQNNLITPLTSFVGRKNDLKSLGSLLNTHRLITLMGPPGVGKTRLSLEFAQTQLSHFETKGGIWFCDLSEAKNREDICTILAQTLEFPLRASLDLSVVVTQLGEALRSRGPLLLILDNFEQIASSAQDTVGNWLNLAPDTKFLITSRERLHLSGETLFDLKPLALPPPEQVQLSKTKTLSFEAVQLFVERACAVDRGYTLHEEDALIVSRLVKELDGIPLAIELATARLRVFTPAQLLKSLDQRFRLLSKNSGAQTGRHEKLERAIDWSWSLLTAFEQEAFLQCSVFRGGFSSEAATEVLAFSQDSDPPWIPDLLQSLCDKSLLVSYETKEVPGERRFRFYQSIREYAWQKLKKSPKYNFLQEQHARYFVCVAQKGGPYLQPVQSLEVFQHFDIELENLLLAYRWALQQAPSDTKRATQALQIALAVAPMLFFQGRFGLRFSLISDALEAAKNVSIKPYLRAIAFGYRGFSQRFLGRFSESVQDLETAYQFAKSEGDQVFMGYALSHIGETFLSQQHLEKAKKILEEATEILRDQGRGDLEANAYNHRGIVELSLGQPDTAETFYQKSLSLYRQANNRRAEGGILGNLGKVELQRGNLTQAQLYYQRALVIHRECNNQYGRAIQLAELGLVEEEQGKLEKAKQYLQSALQFFRTSDTPQYEGLYLIHLGNCYQSNGDFENAQKSYQRALQIHRDTSNLSYEVLTLSHLGSLEAQEENLPISQSIFEEGKKKSKNLGNPCYPVVLYLERGHLDLAQAKAARSQGEMLQAKTFYEKAKQRLTNPNSLSFSQKSFEVRFSLKNLSLALNAFTPFDTATTPQVKQESKKRISEDILLVSLDAYWFHPPKKDKISLTKRRHLRLILKALAKQRMENPGVALPLEYLLKQGWPGERIHPRVQQSRVYNSIAMLRNLGLKDTLIRQGNGYLLDPDLPFSLLDYS